MNLLTYRQQLFADFTALAPAKVKVIDHPGRFDLDELQTYAAQAPCFRIAVLRSADAGLSEPYENVDVAVYVLTKQLDGQEPDEANLFLGGYLKARIWTPGAVGGAEASLPKSVVYQNLYSSTCKRFAVALGAVTFTQLIDLDAYNASAPEPFLRAFTTYGLGDETALDQQTLPQE